MSQAPRPGPEPSTEPTGRWQNTSLVQHAGELIRFSWVGALTLGIYALELWLLERAFGLPTWLAGTLAYGPCVVANYLLHRSFTFRSDKRHFQAGPRYLVVQLGGMLINAGALWLGAEVLAWPYLPAQVVAILAIALWSYLGQKFWTFS